MEIILFLEGEKNSSFEGAKSPLAKIKLDFPSYLAKFAMPTPLQTIYVIYWDSDSKLSKISKKLRFIIANEFFIIANRLNFSKEVMKND